MRVLKLSVRGGGLDFINKFKQPDIDSPLVINRAKQLNLEVGDLLKKLKTGEMLFSLVSETSKLGMLARLCGEDAKVSEIMSSKGEYAKDLLKSAESAVFEPMSEASIEFFSKRYRKTTSVNPSSPPTFCLSEIPGMTGLFHKEISEVLKTSHSPEVYDLVWDQSETASLEKSRDLPRVKILSELIEKIKDNFTKLDAKENTRCHAFVTDCANRLAVATESLTKEFTPSVKIGEFNLNELTLSILEKIFARLSETKKSDYFYSQFMKMVNNGALIPKTCKSWYSETPLTTSGCSWSLKFDFNMYVQVSEEIYAALLNGPQLASFAHAGVVSATAVDEIDMPLISHKVLNYNFNTKQIVGLEKPKTSEAVKLTDYYFSSKNKSIGAYDCHALHRRLFRKDSKITATIKIIDGNLIRVRTSSTLALTENQRINSFEDKNTFTLEKIESFNLDLSSKTKLEISGVISHGKKVRGKEFNLFRNGKFDETELLLFLKLYGLTDVVLSNVKEVSVKSDGKVRIDNCLTFTAGAKIQSNGIEKLHKALAEGIGRRKTYGLGQLDLKVVE